MVDETGVIKAIFNTDATVQQGHHEHQPGAGNTDLLLP